MSEILILFLIFTAIILIVGIISTYESLSWWAGYDENEEPYKPKKYDKRKGAKKFVIFLSGIGAIDKKYLLINESRFVDELKRIKSRETVLIDKIFPYSVEDRSLIDGERRFSKFWENIAKLSQIKEQRKRKILTFLINIRNAYQVMISVDNRYGKIFNKGVGDVVVRSLLDVGFKPNSSDEIHIIGSSGGAQIAVGITPFIKQELECRTSVISIGGIFGNSPALDYLDYFYDIRGQKDLPLYLMNIFTPRKFWFVRVSGWRRLINSQRYIRILLRNITHQGDEGYFGRYMFNKEYKNYQKVASIVTSIIDKN